MFLHYKGGVMLEQIEDFIENISFIGWIVIILFMILTLFAHKLISIIKEMMEE